MGRLWLLLPVLLWCAWQGQSAVGVWRSDVTLWRSVMRDAPTSRALRNLVKADFVESRAR